MAENAGLGVGILVAAGLMELTAPLPTVGLMHGLVIAIAVAFLLSRKAGSTRHRMKPASDPNAKEVLR
jgi:hypothetical protein